MTPHGLRHAHASWLLAGGADSQVVRERLRHGSIVTTEKYLHAVADAKDAALGALAVIRRPVQDAVTRQPPAITTDLDFAEMMVTIGKLKERYDEMLAAVGRSATS